MQQLGLAAVVREVIEREKGRLFTLRRPGDRFTPRLAATSMFHQRRTAPPSEGGDDGTERSQTK